MVATTEREHAVMKGEYNKQIRYTCAYVGCLLSPCMLTYRTTQRDSVRERYLFSLALSRGAPALDFGGVTESGGGLR